VTSPTCMRELMYETGVDIATQVITTLNERIR
jgi:hypothetical protein